jgi:hypothetical protein
MSLIIHTLQAEERLQKKNSCRGVAEEYGLAHITVTDTRGDNNTAGDKYTIDKVDHLMVAVAECSQSSDPTRVVAS